MSPPIVTFEGLSRKESCRDPVRESAGNDIASWPSDDSGAIGPHHYMQSVNLALAIYDRHGNLVHGPVSSCTFWFALAGDCNSNGKDTDHVVLYDRQADRWLVSRPHGGFLYLAVSQTGDPTGTYDQYSFQVDTDGFNPPLEGTAFSTLFNDYPKLGRWRDAYYVTARPRRGDLNLYGIGNTVTAINRDALLCTGRFCLLPDYVTFLVEDPGSLYTQHSHMLPADVDGDALPPVGAPEYVVQVQDEHLDFPSPGHLQVYEFHVDWVHPTLSTLTATTSLTPQDFNSKTCPDVQQPGTPQGLDPLCFGTMMYRLSYRNAGDHEMLLFNHTIQAFGDPAVPEPRWYELRRPLQRLQLANTPWVIYQQGTFAPNEENRWLGSIAMDDGGNIALGFDVSSATRFPSIHYVGRRDSDPLGMLPVGEAALIDGHGAQQGLIPGYPLPLRIPNNQFGDYSQMTVDPTDDCTFWYTNTYYPVNTIPDNWHTRIGAFRFPTCFQFFTRVNALAINPQVGQFTLAARYIVKFAGKEIDPLKQDVTLELGSFSVTIPAGSFTRRQQKNDDKTLAFDGVIGAVHLAIEITPDDGGSFDFEAIGKGATTLPATNPVTAVLTIGADRGAATVNANFGSRDN